MTAIPVLETARLRLRPQRPDDLDSSARMWSDPAMFRLMGGKPSTRDESWQRMVRHAGFWAIAGYGCWVVEDRADGTYLGEAGFMMLKRDLEPSIEGYPELSWMMCPAAQGKGFATEAVRAALGWGDAHIDAAKTTCIIAPANEPSLAVARKCGYSAFAQAVYKDAPIVVLERRRP